MPKLTLPDFGTDMPNKNTQQRQKIYEQGRVIPSYEIKKIKFISSLSKLERNVLGELSKLIFADNLNRIGSFALFAVGTTTYPQSYWNGLRKYLEEKDPSKLYFVERRGEDIDLQVCSEDCMLGKIVMEQALLLLPKILKDGKIKFQVEEYKSHSGTGYIHSSESRGVIRHKQIEYGSTKFRIESQSSRPFHLFFDPLHCVDHKLNIERVHARPFSLLFRHGAYWDLEDAITKVNQTP
ncbi:MAG: hypothetical protein AABX85_02295 [Nanoarchaeota archaeon]